MHRLEEESLLSLEEGTGRPAPPPPFLNTPFLQRGQMVGQTHHGLGRLGGRELCWGQEQLSRTGPHGLGLGVTGEALLQE